MNLEVRSFDIREVNEEKREVTGLAVPYGQLANVGGYEEGFDRGAIEDVSDTKLFWNHAEPIGKVIRGEDTEDGYVITAVISKTARGDEAYTLVRDGVINKFSVGFIPVEHRMEKEAVIRTKVNLKEVSLVPFPAYEGASLTQVRTQTAEEADHNTKENNMENDKIAPEVAELREAVSDLERQVRSFNSKDVATVVENRSGGELLKALAAGDETAKRAFTGATTADAGVGTTWIGGTYKLVDENRQVINLFDKQALPASGNTIEFPAYPTTSGSVEQQVNEGDDLTYMEVALDTATASVKTYGGYSSLSRQAIERSDHAYLSLVLRNQAIEYAKRTEKAVRDAFLAAGPTFGSVALAGSTAADWIGVVLDAEAAIGENGHGASADFALVSADVFKSIATVSASDGRPLFVVNGDGQNTVGSVSVRGLRGSLAGMPVVVGEKLPAGSMYVASREVLTTFESAGAPFRLQDENIINLTKDFSLYGYLAVAVRNAGAAVKVDLAAV